MPDRCSKCRRQKSLLQLSADLLHLDSNWYCHDCYGPASTLAHSKLRGYSCYWADDWASVYLPPEDKDLLIGKRAGRFVLEYGRCTSCGKPDSRCPEIDFFCSIECRKSALDRHLPKDWDWDASYWQDTDVQDASEALTELRVMDWREFRQLKRETGHRFSRDEAKALIKNEIEDTKDDWQRSREIDERRAAKQYENQWLSERDRFLNLARARREADEAKEAAKLAKEQAAEAERLREEERWKPRPLKL